MTFSKEEIYQKVGEIVSNYPLYRCRECAEAVMTWLEVHHIEGQLLRLRTKYRERFVISLRREQMGLFDSIAQNGVHYGVEIYGRVFDNLSQDGLLRQEWINDFCSPTNEFIVDELTQF